MRARNLFTLFTLLTLTRKRFCGFYVSPAAKDTLFTLFKIRIALFTTVRYLVAMTTLVLQQVSQRVSRKSVGGRQQAGRSLHGQPWLLAATAYRKLDEDRRELGIG